MHHGIGQDGFYAEYVAVDLRAAIPLPDGKFLAMKPSNI
jgi:propanol-preferring alcohol dehydrogenase